MVVGHDDPLLVHAVGDRTVELFLNAMELEAKRISWNGRRVRIEHGEGLLPDLIGRARDLGVVVLQDPAISPSGTFSCSAMAKKSTTRRCAR